MSENNIPFDPVKHRQDWLRKLADEFIKLEASMPFKDLLPENGCPRWVANLEREVGDQMYPVAQLKVEARLTPKRLGAIFGHQCAIAVWLMEQINNELESPKEMDLSKSTPAQIEKGVEIINKLTIDWYNALRRLAKRALATCVDQQYESMTEFLMAFATAFARKPSGPGMGGMGNSALDIYNFMLFNWRIIERLNSVHHLHETLVKVFGPFRTGNLKRTEKICQRIELSYRNPGRPKKLK
jgi:hypothetical protein